MPESRRSHSASPWRTSGTPFLGIRHGDVAAAEREADAFAGGLLVPGPLLREALHTTTDARELRRLFKVSTCGSG